MTVPNGSAIYRAKVINDRDPERSGRLRLQIPDVLGEGVTDWCDPCVPFNWFRVVRGHSLEPQDYVEKAVPKPGDVVWATFEAGDVDRPVWLGTWRMSQADSGSEAHEATRIVIGSHTEFEAGYDPTTKADRTIYSTEPPTDPSDGQFWYDLSNSLLYVWDDADQTWLEVTADITVDESWKDWRWPEDLTYIDGGFVGTNTLLANSIYADWLQGNTLVIGNPSAYNISYDSNYDPSTKETPEDAQAKADAAEAAANDFTQLWAEAGIPRQDNPPSSYQVGDFWLDTSGVTDRLRRWDGSQWKTASPEDVSEIGGEQVIPRQDDAPTSPAVHDLWLRTGVSPEVLYRWDGTVWRKVSPTQASDIGAETPEDAQAKADAALNDAKQYTDQVATTQVTTYYQADEPTDPVEGDLWIDTADDRFYRWDGTAWNEIQDSGIADALAAAADAQETADLKVQTFFQVGSPDPVGESVGDLWVHLGAGNHLYRWDGSNWISIQDAEISQALQDAADAQATADGKVTTFYQTTAPTTDSVGDLWFDTGNDKLHRWDGSAWVEFEDSAIADALGAAQSAQATADSKIVSYYQATEPTDADAPPEAGALAWGDFWFDTDDELHPYRFDGSAWISIRDGYIDRALEESKEFVRSRGQNMVTNGYCLLQSDENFTAFHGIDPSERYGGGPSFYISSGSTNRGVDEYIPVDPTQTYRMSYAIKALPDDPAGGQPRHYGMVTCYDADQYAIRVWHVAHSTESRTYLSQPLAPGDTEIHVEDVSGWRDPSVGSASHFYSVTIFPYTNDQGYTYPLWTYSRHANRGVYDGGSIDYTNNIIYLPSPLSGLWNPDDPDGIWPAGTALANSQSGGNYNYIAGSNEETPVDWQVFSGTIGGLAEPGTYPGRNFRQGTAYINVGWLLNRNNPATTWIDAVEFGIDVETKEGAQAKADTAEQNAVTFTEGWAEPSIPRGENPPSSPSAGDFWMDTSAWIDVLRRWDGSTWKAATALDVAELGGEAVIPRQDTAPSSPEDDDLWLDTSSIPERLYRWDAGVGLWRKLSPTEAAEVGADPVGSADAAQAAAEAHADGKVYIYPSNQYDETADASVYNPKPGMAIMQITSGSWPASYGNLVTWWTDPQRAVQEVTDHQNKAWVREVHPASYPVWSDWKEIEDTAGAQARADAAQSAAEANAQAFTEAWAEKQVPKQDTAPTSPEIGDFWLDTSGSFDILKRWDGSDWRKATATEVWEIGGEGAIPKQDTAPTNPNDGDLWLDTSVYPEVLYRWNGSEWRKTSPTDAVDIGAETPEGAQAKADLAEQTAIDWANNEFDFTKPWRWPSDLTLIDGGNIGTDTIVANSISARAIEARHARIGLGTNIWPDPNFQNDPLDKFADYFESTHYFWEFYEGTAGWALFKNSPRSLRWNPVETADNYVLQDDLESFSGWNTFGLGNIYHDSTQAKVGTHSLRKDDNNDPDGGYKLLSQSVTDFWFSCWFYRPAGTSGGSANRVWLGDANGNGYGINLNYGNYFAIERRDADTGTTLDSSTVTPTEDVWLQVTFWRHGSGMGANLFDDAGNRLIAVETSDSTYGGALDRFVISGGYHYFVDDIRVGNTLSAALYPAPVGTPLGGASVDDHGIRVAAGERLDMSFHACASSAYENFGGGVARAQINFFDKDGNSLASHTSGFSRVVSSSIGLSSETARFKVSTEAPDGAAFATPIVRLLLPGPPGGAVYIGNVNFSRSLSASLVVDGRIQAGEGIRSDNYDPFTAGWEIDGDGNAEFNNVMIRGIIDNPSVYIDDDQVFFRRSGANVGSVYPPSNGGIVLDAIDSSVVHSKIWIRDADEIQFHASWRYNFLYTNAVISVQGHLGVSGETDLYGPVRRGNSPVSTPRGIDGGYSDFSGSGSDWGANIWSIGDSWSGTGEGSGFTVSGGSSQYGLTWLRSSHSQAGVSEGLYIWRAGSRVAAFGLSGASLPYGVSGSLDVSGSVSLSGSLYLGSSAIYESGGSYVYVKPTSSGNIAARLADSNATYTTGFPALGAQTTSSSPNVYSTSGGYLYRSTSSRKYKFDVENLDPLYNHVLDLRPVWHRSLSRHDKEGWSYWGFIAEEVDEIDPRLVHYNEESGEPEGVQYEKITVLLQERVKKHEETIADLQRELADLKEKV